MKFLKMATIIAVLALLPIEAVRSDDSDVETAFSSYANSPNEETLLDLDNVFLSSIVDEFPEIYSRLTDFDARQPRESLDLSGIALPGPVLAQLMKYIAIKAPALRILDLSASQIEDLPHEIVLLSRLEKLSLKGNELRKVPEAVFRLTSLKWLSLAENSLSHLSSDIKDLEKLKYLDVSENRLLFLPSALLANEGMKLKGLKSNTWFKVEDGKLVEASEVGSLQAQTISMLLKAGYPLLEGWLPEGMRPSVEKRVHALSQGANMGVLVRFEGVKGLSIPFGTVWSGDYVSSEVAGFVDSHGERSVYLFKDSP